MASCGFWSNFPCCSSEVKNVDPGQRLVNEAQAQHIKAEHPRMHPDVSRVQLASAKRLAGNGKKVSFVLHGKNIPTAREAKQLVKSTSERLPGIQEGKAKEEKEKRDKNALDATSIGSVTVVVASPPP